ncbi:uridylate kinase [Phlyctema vagabunda]|uniref:Uridylate kinase n=1 Tax=Phlyctema vagabunda TaxID=108571 RepID=A0ABR4PKT3_9HELO
MAHLIPRIISRRAWSSTCQPSIAASTSSASASLSHAICRARPAPANAFRSSYNARVPRRGYAATGEKGPRPVPGQSPFKVWPFIAIFLAGTGSYVLMVNQRLDMPPAIDAPKTSGQIAAPQKSTPTFSPDKVTVLYVLGGPGAGKGTQCANLVRDYGFTHLSAGDLLRAEQDRPDSEFGQLIKDCIKEGSIVPMEVTVQLLENAMQAAVDQSRDGRGKFLIDGFPRKMDQAVKFEETVCPSKFVLFYDCPEQEMERRLLKRGETSGRSDDNAESIKKRFKTFVETSMPVVDYFEKEDRVVKVVATRSPAEVYKETQQQIEKRLGSKF